MNRDFSSTLEFESRKKAIFRVRIWKFVSYLSYFCFLLCLDLSEASSKILTSYYFGVWYWTFLEDIILPSEVIPWTVKRSGSTLVVILSSFILSDSDSQSLPTSFSLCFKSSRPSSLEVKMLDSWPGAILMLEFSMLDSPLLYFLSLLF